MKKIVAKFPGQCDLCGGSFPKGETIAYNGRCHHVACVERTAEEERAEDLRRWDEQKAWSEARARGEHIKSRLVGTRLYVEGAPDYKMARDEAFAFISSIAAATGTPCFLRVKVRNGKRLIGREEIHYYGGSNIPHHEGWSFDTVGVAA